ncbi:hypothetical protein MNBD_GAMMA12-1063 [hydrothermal vent metagenome]|uniref:2-polyprenylphenol hydroxylase and related flavodoxin oxidoreductases / CDP-6-deoxy-delta-3,4-glucoseen reductase-like n=1 Tax=hydrothermal vent metagenome TaxID=652676 RepID=A0A3B0ZNS6_9ZZZZ
MNYSLKFQGRDYPLENKETVLDCLLAKKVTIPHSCKSGSCQSCLMQAVEGEIPRQAQLGLKPSYKRQRLFLACQCRPVEDMTVKTVEQSDVNTSTTLVKREYLNHNVLKICLRPQALFECEPGQYISLFSSAGDLRNYSVANNPLRDGFIELHIRVVENGLVSGWLKDQVAIDDEVIVRGPAGDCFYYCEDDNEFPISLVGTGTGLAPIYGIAKEAIVKKHKGLIQLFHGVLDKDDLYLADKLQVLDDQYENFNYIPCVLNGEEGEFYQTGDIQSLAYSHITDKAMTRLFLCGAPEMVKSLKTNAFMAGLASKNIFSDSFIPA